MKHLARKVIPKQLYIKISLYRFFHKLINRTDSFLAQTGYITSYFAGVPYNSEQQFVPWMNSSFVEFLSHRLTKMQSVFEYGTGYSTIFFAGKVKDITSVEYDQVWLAKISSLAEAHKNVEILFIPDKEAYAGAVAQREKIYEIIVLDGNDRAASADYALERLTYDGIVILDDSEREEYGSIFNLFKKHEFKELTISGFKPFTYTLSSTTIFYRTINCFGI